MTKVDTHLLEEFGKEFKARAGQLQPYSDRCSFYVGHVSSVLWSYFDRLKEVPSCYLHHTATFISRSWSLSIELLLPGPRLALYMVFPQTQEHLEKVVKSNFEGLKADYDPQWQCFIVAFLRVEIPKVFGTEARIEGARLVHCGDFAVGEGEKPTHRLYLCGFTCRFVGEKVGVEPIA